MVDLPALKDEIAALGAKIKSTKESGGDVSTLIPELLAKKKLYAENNDGIGVDGKPFEQLTKAQKKAKAKAEKAAQAAAAAPSNQNNQQESKGAQKKAAKKAAAKAKREAYKDGAPPVVDGGGQARGGPAAAQAAAKPSVVAAKPPLPPVASSLRISPGQIAINPNVPLTERPVVALSVAVLTRAIIDWRLVSDHHCRHTVLCTTDGTAVTGDRAMARYLAKTAPANMSSLLGNSPAVAASVDAWMDYAASLSLLDQSQAIKAVAMTLQHALDKQTYLVGHTMSLADIGLFSVIGFPTQVSDVKSVLERLPEHASAAHRWISMMASHPALQEATQLCLGVTNLQEGTFDETRPAMEPTVTGMNPLEGGVAGRVVTRFPPEPSGYLHIGHAKAALLNDYYARRYQGRLILRFDDTNPSKEKEEYQESIVVDLEKLEIKPDLVTYTSDYLETIMGYAKQMIKQGLAFMDDTPQEQMKTERADRQDSKHRNQSSEDALKYFDLMCSGSPEGGEFCLRAKIDMKSNNGTMRDPVLYRQNLTPHHRSGTKYKAYPTYDLACPIVDSIEGVTHALRTTEYDDRNEQYQWILKALGLRRPRNITFSRVNFEYTVLSKRKLTWFVEKGYVAGWDDPRFPTVRGVVRRGINIQALRNFMYAQGASRNVVNMVWHSFWASNKKEIDETAKRFMAIDKENHTKLVVTNGPKAGDFAFRETPFHPKKPEMGTRVIRISDSVLLENIDAEGIVVGEEIVLVRWGVVKITKVDTASRTLEGEYVPDGDFRAAKKKLSWIAAVENNCPVVLQEFDHLVTKDKFEDGDNFEDHINPTTMATTDVIGDAGLTTLKEHDIIQLERRGFYRVDKPYMGPGKPMVLIMIPDGRSKTMGGLQGKLAHH